MAFCYGIYKYIRKAKPHHDRQVVATTKKVDGIDISHHNGTIDFATIKKNNSNIQFVYIKATEGSTHKDSEYNRNVTNAGKNGFNVGAYHFFTMGSSAEQQFNNFKSLVGKKNINLIPMVDVEAYVNIKGYHIGNYYFNNKNQKKEIMHRLQKLLDLLEREYDAKPIIYCNDGSYNHLIKGHFGKYKLYFDDYAKICHISNYTIWQFSEKGQLKGMNKKVDVARFHNKATINDIILPK